MGVTRLENNMAEGKLVIDVVDNGGQWTHREWRMLRYLRGVKIPQISSLHQRSSQGLLLEGRVLLIAKMAREFGEQ